MRTPKLPPNQILSLLLVTTVLVFFLTISEDMASQIAKENEVAGSGSSNYVQLQESNGYDTAADSVGNNGTKDNPVETVPSPSDKEILCPLINSQGICESCKDDEATDRAVICLFCDKQFHAICKISDKYQNNTCNKTFFDQYSRRMGNSSLQGSFNFICSPCMTTFEQQRAANLQSHVQTLERKVDTMECSLREIKEILTCQKPHPHVAPQQLPEPMKPSNPWLDREGLEKIKSKVPLIVKKTQSGNDVPETAIEKIVMDNNIQVDSCYNNRLGDRVLVVSSESDRQKLSSKLSQAFPESQVQQPPERLPTISLSNIQENINPEKLKNNILSLNSEISNLIDDGDRFEVLYVKPQRKGNNYQACIRVSNRIRKFIEVRGNKLYVGMYSCNIYDHFYVKRCNRCQKFHHYADKCKATVPTCAKCAGSHNTTDCHDSQAPSFVPTCVNCSQSTKQNHTHTHYASSLDCPTYQAAQDELRKSIRYYSSKNL